MNLSLVGILLLVALGSCQKCLNHAGKEVNWFVILITPGSVAESYHYYDSDSRDSFTYHLGEPDQLRHPIYNTFNYLSNSTYEIIAWNDQLPNGSTSSAKAHSKTVIGYDLAAQTGIVIDHSMPLYPAINQKDINSTISDSQSVYGQHFFCFKSGFQTKDILTKSSIISPYFYANTRKDDFTLVTSSLFEFSNLDVGSSRIKAIFKNGKLNGSIFEDGLTLMLGSDLIAETWGRPISSPWCGGQNNKLKVGNAAVLEFSDQVSWKQTLDHSKWAIPSDESSNYSCFGDMNRMDSQFKRGGAFYCIQNKGLKTALKNIIKSATLC